MKALVILSSCHPFTPSPAHLSSLPGATSQQSAPASRRRLLDVGAHAGRFVGSRARPGGRRRARAQSARPLRTPRSAPARPFRQLNVHQSMSRDRVTTPSRSPTCSSTFPIRCACWRGPRALLAPGGWLAIKVPCGPAQLFKEIGARACSPAIAPTLADNLVHVNHFSPRVAAARARARRLRDVTVEPGAPELPGGPGGADRPRAARALYTSRARARRRHLLWP